MAFHMLFLDGVYIKKEKSRKNTLRFLSITTPKVSEIVALTHKISLRIGRYLERTGYIERDEESSYLTFDMLAEDTISTHRSHSIQYRIAMGSQKGRKVFGLKTLPPHFDDRQREVLGKVSGFSLHAGVSVKASQRDKLERLCRYISRPALSVHRLSETKDGNIRYELKTPYRDGTTHMIFNPLDFISKLAALIPIPRVNLTRFHAIFAPNSRTRDQVIRSLKAKESDTRTEKERRHAMCWAQRLKRAFNIDGLLPKRVFINC